jgi:hypothetical protein
MSNTYFEQVKEVTYNDIKPEHTYANKYRLSLAAFMGGKTGDVVQLTVQTDSTLPMQSGTAYITLSDADIDVLIAGLLERKLNKISSTGEEKSIFSPPKVDES